MANPAFYFDPDVQGVEKEGKVFLEITLPEEMFRVKSKVVTSLGLGMTRISEAKYEKKI